MADQAVPPEEAPPPEGGPPAEGGLQALGLHPALDPSNISTATQSTAQEATQLEQLANSKLQQQQLEGQAASEVAQAENEAYRASLDQAEGALGGRAQQRDMARRASALKLAAAQQRVDDLTNKEPDPGRFWANADGYKKAAYALAVVAGIYANSRNPGAKNAAIEQLLSEVDADVAEQRSTLGRQRAAALSNLDQTRADEQERLSEIEESYQQTLARIASLSKVAQAKAQQAGAGSRAAAAYEGVRQELLGAAAQLTQRTGERLEKQENQLREFADARKRQSREFGHADQMQSRSFQQQERMAGIELRNDLIKKGAGEAEDLRFVPPKSGLRLVTNQKDDKGNAIVIPSEQAKLHKDYVLKAGEIAAGANQMTDDLAQLQELLSDRSNWDAIVKDDALYNSKITEVVRRIITNPAFNKGATADRDELAGFAVAEGTPANGGTVAKLANFSKRADNARAAIGRLQKDLPSSINNALKQFPLPQGGNLEWVPPDPPAKLSDNEKYLMPGEEDALLSKSTAEQFGIPPDEAVRRPTTLAPITDEQVKIAKAIEPDLEGMTPETMAKVIKAKLPGDAAVRVVRANEEVFEKARKKLDQVAEGLVKKNAKQSFVKTSTFRGLLYDSTYSPSKEEMRKELVKAGFAPGKLLEEDYKNLKAKAEAWAEKQIGLELARRGKK